MKRYSVRNVEKAARLCLAQQKASETPYLGFLLTLRSGIDNGFVAERQYKTIRGLLRNTGRRVRAFFYSDVTSSGRRYSTGVRFEATF